MLVAIQKTVIDNYWKIANLAGGNVGMIGISSLQAVRALALNGEAAEQMFAEAGKAFKPLLEKNPKDAFQR